MATNSNAPPALEVPLDAQTATCLRSNAHLAHEIVERALIDHGFPARLVIFTHERELLASVNGPEITFHVPLAATVQEVTLPHDAPGVEEEKVDVHS
ncbi:MAG: hypothetical protein H6713_03685 [Myxococcales bacterium]|nr:hypothetical protein [Myxococcales bacterium]